jgi:hypothetical protein
VKGKVSLPCHKSERSAAKALSADTSKTGQASESIERPVEGVVKDGLDVL